MTGAHGDWLRVNATYTFRVAGRKSGKGRATHMEVHLVGLGICCIAALIILGVEQLVG